MDNLSSTRLGLACAFINGNSVSSEYLEQFPFLLELIIKG